MPESNSLAHSKGFRFGTWAAAILVVTAGVYLSYIQFMGREWLSRAGCLIVMLGIWSGMGAIFQERLAISRTKWLRRNAVTAAKARIAEQGLEPEQAERELAELNAAFDNQVADTTQNLRLSLGIIEVSLLLTGTFLWGFGDLFFRDS